MVWMHNLQRIQTDKLLDHFDTKHSARAFISKSNFAVDLDDERVRTELSEIAVLFLALLKLALGGLEVGNVGANRDNAAGRRSVFGQPNGSAVREELFSARSIGNLVLFDPIIDPRLFPPACPVDLPAIDLCLQQILVRHTHGNKTRDRGEELQLLGVESGDAVIGIEHDKAIWDGVQGVSKHRDLVDQLCLGFFRVIQAVGCSLVAFSLWPACQLRSCSPY